MKLTEYIKDIGTAKFSEMFDVSRQQAWALMTMQSLPEPKLAHKVIKETSGLVTWEEVYGPAFESKKKSDNKQLEFKI